ncbi:hypothetical protein ACFSKN_11375 [Mariniflexile gromovii]|uniref:Uncharacterized protein n=1 Tax=Mariniflexile gromovii TaxID=362523 RepID=A0ABS4BV96_9FLAO|nr:hypothetical protein [Mariniflexile gromovii]MBP0904492.1 hypothetical protein [Mariniflexile gromovii]
MKRIFFILFIVTISFFNCAKDDTPVDPEPNPDTLYFPPINSETWETASITELGWNESALQPLLDLSSPK